ncbi:MAG: RagB/SusD family nutrient uptake outer membrane protein [Salinibacter sp.]
MITIDNIRSSDQRRSLMRYAGLVLLAFASVAFVFTGCDTQEFLNSQRQSSDAGPGQGDWQSPADLDDVLSTGYWYMSGAGFGGESMVGRGYQVRTVQTDVAVPYVDAGGGNQLEPGGATTLYGRQSTNPAYGFTEDIWTTCYHIIGNANEVIGFIKNEFRGGGGKPFSDPSNEIPRIYGEALVMRAIANWNLATIFAPPYSQNTLQNQSVVIRKTKVSSVEDSNKPPGTVEELYSLIESDLKKAIKELPETPEDAKEYYNYSRFTKSAAEFLLARVSLQMQKWGQAQEYATKVIEDSKFDLSQDPLNAFNQNTYTRPNEVIWYFAYVDGNGVNSSPWKDLKTFDAWAWNVAEEQRFVAASYSFMEKAGWVNPSDTSVTSTATNDLRYQQLWKRCEAGGACNGLTFNDRVTFWSNKFFRQGTGTNVPMFRLPEMYLTRALASYTGNNGATQNQSQALSDVNAVRSRAGLSDLSSLSVEDIHRERMREMAFEGDRLYYLRANRVAVPNGDTNAGSGFGDGDFIINGGRQPGGSVAWDSDDFVWPIPEAERETNTAID